MGFQGARLCNRRERNLRARVAFRVVIGSLSLLHGEHIVAPRLRPTDKVRGCRYARLHQANQLRNACSDAEFFATKLRCRRGTFGSKSSICPT